MATPAGPTTTAGLVWGLERLVTERDAHLASQPELVWTGPETPGAGSRDTRVVEEELFRSAERRVLVTTSAIHRGAEVSSLLAERMQAVPGLSVRLFVNITRLDPCPTDAGEARKVRGFRQRFVQYDWPARARLPELFYDPRALSPDPGPKACLHAKCIVVDDCRAFVTSANFTEAAQERNIETGVLVSEPTFACALRDQFESLVTAGLLRGVPSLGSARRTRAGGLPRGLGNGERTGETTDGRDNEPRTTDHGPRTTDHGPRTTDRLDSPSARRAGAEGLAGAPRD